MFKIHIKIIVIFMDIEVFDTILLKSEMTERQLQLDYCGSPSEICEYPRVQFIRIPVACCSVHSGSRHIISFRITISSASFSQKTNRSPFFASSFLAILKLKTIFMPSAIVVVPKIFIDVLMQGKLYIPHHSYGYEQSIMYKSLASVGEIATFLKAFQLAKAEVKL
jgi:hypothetical protein